MEAFVYCWTDHKTKKLYVGSHKGSTDDGYICSSKPMKKEYFKRPGDFTRQIIAEGTWPDCFALEIKILQTVDAKKNPKFYNRHNGVGNCYCERHDEETKNKLKEIWRLRSPQLKEKMRLRHVGAKRPQTTRLKMSENCPKNSLGKKWFNNGIIERYSKEPIIGWTKGRLPGQGGNKRGRINGI